MIRKLLFFICAVLPFHFANAAAVSPGIERLFLKPYIGLIENQRLGVLAHNASRDHLGNHIVDLLASHKNIHLQMIFAPEHGYRSVDDHLLPDSIDPQTGLPVYSLYGPRQAPTVEMLRQIDAVIIDLQDVGVRFYTYPATMVYTMQACKAAGKKVIVLDRPNPLGGEVVEGAVLEPSLANGSLTTLAQIPTRHGMTMGELALFYNKSLGINADVTVVPLSGWKRSMLWSATNLPWVPPSPALLNSEQALLYGVFGSLENLKIAVGRGKINDLAFHVYGAPWINPSQSLRLVKKFKNLNLKGLSFSPTHWLATRGEFKGRVCHGFRVDILDERHVDGFFSLLNVLTVMNRILGVNLGLTQATKALGAQWLTDGILAHMSVQSLVQRAQKSYPSFLKARSEVLIYP